MKLSEAIREGAKLRPQTHRRYWQPNGSCALGAAVEATKGSVAASSVSIREHLNEVWQGLRDTYKYCPVDCCRWQRHEALYDVPAIVVHLNDDHDWTREEIADWVEKEGF